jgi:hypothetical protein
MNRTVSLQLALVSQPQPPPSQQKVQERTQSRNPTQSTRFFKTNPISLTGQKLSLSKVSVALLFVAGVIASAQSAPQGDGREQETQARGLWTDPSTGLMWAGKHNGKHVSSNKARKYCHAHARVVRARSRKMMCSQDAATCCMGTITCDFSYPIHFPVVAYPKNGILTAKSFVFFRNILYSHSQVQPVRVALDVLRLSLGKGVVGEPL